MLNEVSWMQVPADQALDECFHAPDGSDTGAVRIFGREPCRGMDLTPTYRLPIKATSDRA